MILSEEWFCLIQLKTPGLKFLMPAVSNHPPKRQTNVGIKASSFLITARESKSVYSKGIKISLTRKTTGKSTCSELTHIWEPQSWGLGGLCGGGGWDKRECLTPQTSPHYELYLIGRKKKKMYILLPKHSTGLKIYTVEPPLRHSDYSHHSNLLGTRTQDAKTKIPSDANP